MRVLGACLLSASLLAPLSHCEARDALWSGAWGFAPTPLPQSVAPPGGEPVLTTYSNVTIRQLVRVSQAAKRVRVRISNEYGDRPLQVGAMRIALSAGGGRVQPGSSHTLTFAGHPDTRVAAGAPALSDPVELDVPALTKLAVSIYLPAESAAPGHRTSEYISAAGNAVDAIDMPDATLLRAGALVSQIQVESTSTPRVVVTMGDSITEGFGSSVNEFHGWADLLAERLNSDRKTREWGVVNAGINSNRLLHNGPGMGALARFDRDVLAVPGVSLLILFEGINDIGYSHTVPAEAVAAEDIIGAYQQLILRAHAHGIRIIGATLGPYRDSHYYVPEGEMIRHDVNEWIRHGGAFDGVIDFDAVLRDPQDVLQVNSALQRGDHLHPNDAGYAAMANAIDLKMFYKR